MLGLSLGLSLVSGGGGVQGISFVAGVNAAVPGGSVPDGAVGDFVWGSAQQTGGGAVAPSVPADSGWTTPTGTADITANVTGSNVGASAAYQFMTTAQAIGGQWTNSNTHVYGRYAGVNTTTPLLSLKWATGSSGDIAFPALSHDDETAWVLLFWRTANDVTLAPSGFTSRTGAARRYLFDSAGPMQTFAGLNVTPSGTAGLWVCGAAAIKAA